MSRRGSIGFIFAAVFFHGVAHADAYRLARIDAPGCTSTAARGINNVGQIVGTCTTASGTRGFLASGGIYSSIEFPAATFTSPSGIDSNGRIVGFYTFADNVPHGFLFAAGGFSTLDVPGAASSQALAIDDAGRIVGTFTDSHGEHGFLYQAGSFTPIDVPGAASTSTTGIDNAGDIVGVFTGANSRAHGFLYANVAFSTLDAPDGEPPVTLGINDAREAVGISGLLYRDGAFTNIEVSGAPRKLHHSGIDNAGAIVGSYVDASGSWHGFLATPIPPANLTAEPRPATLAATNLSNPVPRTSSSPGVCAVTGDNPASVADVQRMLSEALGKVQAANDLNSDGAVNVADIQVVVNAVLQLGCTPIAQQGNGTVAHLSVESGNAQVACICETATLQAFQPISVLATNASGSPVSGATVNWTVTSGQMTIAGPTSVTGSNGIATQDISLLVLNNFTSTSVPYLVSTVQATSNNNSVIFTETQSLVTSQGSSVIQANPPQYGGQELGGVTLSGNIGTTLSTPIQTQIAGLGIASNGVPNVSVRILNGQSSPALTCSTGNNADPGSVISDQQGNTSCYVTFSGSGTGTFNLIVGGVAGNNQCVDALTSSASACYLESFGPFTFTSLAGAPAAVQIVSGNNQVTPIGQSMNPLVARLVDAHGNVIPGQTMEWSVSPAGAAALNNGPLVTDANGEVSTTGTLDILASAGVSITVALQSNTAISATFQETVPNAITSMTKISGDNQSAALGANFATALVVKLANSSGPVTYFPVHFAVSGPVNLSTTVADTDVNGEASITAMAGSSSGTATVTATAGALSQTFTLTVTGQ